MKSTSLSQVKFNIDESRISRFQILTIAICTFINMIDGFDVLVMAFTASSISSEWQIPKSELGLLLSAGLVGMAVGALFIAPFADKIGRKKLILLSLVIVSIGMLSSAFSQNVTQLSVLRFITGLGIGGMLATLNTLVSEYSNKRNKNICVSILQSGYPVGAIIGGIISVYLIKAYGWQSTFLFGGCISLLMIPLVYFILPESLDFLFVKQPKNALTSINKILNKLNQPIIKQLPSEIINGEQSSPLSSLFNLNNLSNTLVIWTAYFMLMFSFYFIVSWTPKLLVDAGLSTSVGISGGVIIQVGGVIGALTLGFIASKINVIRLTSVYLTCCTTMMIIFGSLQFSLPILMTFAFIMGFFLVGSMIGLYALTPTLYSAFNRNTGMGWAIGIGRFGAVISPILAGYLLENSWKMTTIVLLFSMPMLFAAFILSLIKFENDHSLEKRVERGKHHKIKGL